MEQRTSEHYRSQCGSRDRLCEEWRSGQIRTCHHQKKYSFSQSTSSGYEEAVPGRNLPSTSVCLSMFLSNLKFNWGIVLSTTSLHKGRFVVF